METIYRQARRKLPSVVPPPGLGVVIGGGEVRERGQARVFFV